MAPQTAEGITMLKWFKESQLVPVPTYNSIRDVITNTKNLK